MELHNYLWYLNYSRHFNKELAITYTKEIYGTDLIGIIDEYDLFWDVKENIYDSFRSKRNYTYDEDDGTREYFNKRGRMIYLDFMDFSYFEKENCSLFWTFKFSDVHHIFPLIYGGNSQLENLIHLSKFNHDILHENLRENDRIWCFRALDYLGHLYSPNKTEEIIKKYNVFQFKDSMASDVFKLSIKEEMRNFYNQNMTYRQAIHE